jgi:hypothetical protein
LTKSSEVLRLAAEYACNKNWPYISNSMIFFGIDPLGYTANSVWNFMEEWDLFFDDYEQTITCLCLAAAIAESEGD